LSCKKPQAGSPSAHPGDIPWRTTGWRAGAEDAASAKVASRVGESCKQPTSALRRVTDALDHGIVALGFWFLVCYAATQLATQSRQRCIQVVCSNKEARKRLTESNGTPAMDLGQMNFGLKEYYFYVLFCDCCFEVDIRIRRYTNKDQ